MALTDTRPASLSLKPDLELERPSTPHTRPRLSGGRRWGRAALIGGALIAALAGLHVVLFDLSWFAVGALFAVIPLAAAAIARGISRRRWLPSVVATAASIMALTLVYAPSTAVLWFIPTPETLGRFHTLIQSGSDSIADQGRPAAPQLGIVFIIAMLLAACAILSDLTVELGAPALVALPLLAILGVPVAIHPDLVDAFWYLVVAVLYLAILRIGGQPASRRVTILAGAVVAVGSLVTPFVFPVVSEDASPTNLGLQAGLNPIIALGDDLRRPAAVPALQYTTNSVDQVYLRLATLDNFNGQIWSPSTVQQRGGSNVSSMPAPKGLAPAVGRTVSTVSVTVADISGRWLPVPYPTTKITGLKGGDWYAEEEGLSVRSDNTGVRGQTYTAQFLSPSPTRAQLVNAAAPVYTAGSRYLDVPTGTPAIVAQTAREVTATAANNFDRARALQNYFRTEFTYSVDTPVREGYDGTSVDIIAKFLEVKAGYCVHFASAMALMARTLGIPSRVAVGFEPGQSIFNHGNVFQLTSHDLHAWPELYFEGTGWLRFEPTPGRGEVPSYGGIAVGNDTTIDPSATPTAAPTTAANSRKVAEDHNAAAASAANAATATAVAVISGIVLLLILIALTPAAIRVGMRERRWIRMRGSTGAAAAAWAELRDTARDHGWAAPDTETPREFSERLGVVLIDDRGAINEFRNNVEAVAFGRDDRVAISRAELRAVRKAIARSSNWRTRLRVFFVPPSLLRRWHWNPDD